MKFISETNSPIQNINIVKINVIFFFLDIYILLSSNLSLDIVKIRNPIQNRTKILLLNLKSHNTFPITQTIDPNNIIKGCNEVCFSINKKYILKLIHLELWIKYLLE